MYTDNGKLNIMWQNEQKYYQVIQHFFIYLSFEFSEFNIYKAYSFYLHYCLKYSSQDILLKKKIVHENINNTSYLRVNKRRTFTTDKNCFFTCWKILILYYYFYKILVIKSLYCKVSLHFLFFFHIYQYNMQIASIPLIKILKFHSFDEILITELN